MSKSGGNLRALVRFNLPAMPQGCSVESATLRIYAKSAASGRTLQAFQLGGSWTEGGVTWANQPATTGGAVDDELRHRLPRVERRRDGAVDVHEREQRLPHPRREREPGRRAAVPQPRESTNRPQLVVKLGTPPPPPPNGVPDTQITGSPLAATSSTSATFTFTGTDDVDAGG